MATTIPNDWREYINRKIGVSPELVPLASASGQSQQMPVLQRQLDEAERSDVLTMPVSSNNILSQAIAAKSAKQNDITGNTDSDGPKPGELQEEYMKRTGRQSELDQAGAQVVPNVQATSPRLEPEFLKPVQTQMAETGRQSELDNLSSQSALPTQQNKQQVSDLPAQPVDYKQGSLGENIVVTGRANRYYSDNPAYGVNAGTDFAGEQGTAVTLPEGKWRVVEARNDVRGRAPGNFSEYTNKGWGNSVVVENQETGERMRMSHMQYGSVPDLKPGQQLQGGTVIGAIGNTGNTRGRTGNHLDVEYYDQRGKRGDVLNTEYAEGLFGSPSLRPAVQEQTVAPQATVSAQPRLDDLVVEQNQEASSSAEMQNPFIMPTLIKQFLQG